MHNALSNSAMRALLMLRTQRHLDCCGWKIVTKENKNGKRLIHKFPPRAALSTALPEQRWSAVSWNSLLLQGNKQQSFIFGSTRSVLVFHRLHALSLLGLFSVRLPAALIKYWNLPEWLHQIFSKSVVLDTERLGALRFGATPDRLVLSPEKRELREIVTSTSRHH